MSCAPFPPNKSMDKGMQGILEIKGAVCAAESSLNASSGVPLIHNNATDAAMRFVVTEVESRNI
jgi:UDP-N-acetylmuramyl pentapeptide synthase